MGITISGTITRVTAQVVDVTTEAAGAIHLKRELVKAMLSGAGVPVVGADGKEHAAFLVPAEDWGGWHEGAEVAVVPGASGAGGAAQGRRPLTAAMVFAAAGWAGGFGIFGVIDLGAESGVGAGADDYRWAAAVAESWGGAGDGEWFDQRGAGGDVQAGGDGVE